MTMFGKWSQKILYFKTMLYNFKNQRFDSSFCLRWFGKRDLQFSTTCRTFCKPSSCFAAFKKSKHSLTPLYAASLTTQRCFTTVFPIFLLLPIFNWHMQKSWINIKGPEKGPWVWADKRSNFFFNVHRWKIGFSKSCATPLYTFPLILTLNNTICYFASDFIIQALLSSNRASGTNFSVRYHISLWSPKAFRAEVAIWALCVLYLSKTLISFMSFMGAEAGRGQASHQGT